MKEIIIDALLDTAKLLPLLFVAYIAIEYFEGKFEGKSEQLIIKNKKIGVLGGGIIGVIPQCGFAAGAASLYSNGMISAGTLIAVFVSASDEMLPIMISMAVSGTTIFAVLALKVGFALFFGFLADAIFFKNSASSVKDVCADANCNCRENGIFLSALKHTVNVAIFILITNFALNCAISFIGEDTLSSLVVVKPYVSEIICAIIGLIPNCAASVMITQLFAEGIISAGALIAGLCVNSGVGIMVLFRTNKPFKENIKLSLYLYITSVVAGMFIEALNISF